MFDSTAFFGQLLEALELAAAALTISALVFVPTAMAAKGREGKGLVRADSVEHTKQR